MGLFTFSSKLKLSDLEEIEEFIYKTFQGISVKSQEVERCKEKVKLLFPKGSREKIGGKRLEKISRISLLVKELTKGILNYGNSVLFATILTTKEIEENYPFLLKEIINSNHTKIVRNFNIGREKKRRNVEIIFEKIDKGNSVNIIRIFIRDVNNLQELEFLLLIDKAKKGFLFIYPASKEIRERVISDNTLINLLKEGITTIFLKSEIKEKIRNRNLEKYGVDNPTKNKTIAEKISKKKKELLNKNTNLKSELIEKLRNGLKEKYGVDNSAKLDFVRRKISEKNKKKWKQKLLKIFLSFVENNRDKLLERFFNNDEEKLTIWFREIIKNIESQQIRNLTQIPEILELLREHISYGRLKQIGLSKEDVNQLWKIRTGQETLNYTSKLEIVENLTKKYNISSITAYRVITKWKEDTINRKKLSVVNRSSLEDVILSTIEELIRNPNISKSIKDTYRIKTNKRYTIDNDNFRYNYKTFEFDIVVEDVKTQKEKLIIEINGLVYHSIGKKPLYNLDRLNSLKYKDFEKVNFVIEELKASPLILWENEILEPIKYEIVKNILTYRLGFAKYLHTPIYGRDVGKQYDISILKKDKDFVRVPNEIKDFFNKNHIKGWKHNTRADYIIVLSQKGTGNILSSIILEENKNSSFYYEIVRSVVAKGYYGAGLFSKLLSSFRKEVSINKSLIFKTYVDRRFFADIKTFNNLSNVLKIETTKPNYYYLDFSNRQNIFGLPKILSRINFQKHKLLKLFSNNNNTQCNNLEHLTEFEIVFKCFDHLRIIFDAGNYSILFSV